MASIRKQLALERQLQCMRIVDGEGNISTRALADRLSISNGAAYYVLKALVQKGFVKVDNFKNSHKKSGYFYLLTPAGLQEKSRLTAKFIWLKKVEYYALREEIEALERELQG